MIDQIWMELNKYGIYSEGDLDREISLIDVSVFCGRKKDEQTEH